MPSRSKFFVRKAVRREHESPIDTLSAPSPTTASVQQPLLIGDDYEAPTTAGTLSPNSKWLIVRNNIHKIRSWGAIRHMSEVEQRHQDWYLFFQMRRELKRAEEKIRAIQFRPDFVPVHHFELPIDEKLVRRYNVSHVRPTDGIYYAGLGSEPIVLQYLLYYFSKESSVPYNSMFYSFLSDVNSVLYTNRQRITRVLVLRRVAFFITLAVFVLLLLMFFSLILSVITTMTKFHQMYGDQADPSKEWASVKSTAPTSSFSWRLARASCQYPV